MKQRFSNYITSWLYGDGGYYTTFKEIGKKGDFYTAVSTSKFFGGAIAMRILQSIDEGFLSENLTIVEVGAHKGYLLADIIEFLFTLRPNLLKSTSFAIVERFDEIKEVQKNYFKESFADEIKLMHYSSLDEIDASCAFVVANEVFDAFSAEVVANGKMLYVDEHKLTWEEMDDKTALISSKYNIKKGEIGLGFGEFAQSLAKMKRCEFVSFDYGQNFARNDISLRIYHEHKTYPLFEGGLNLGDFYQKSDITFDVNFEQLIDEFEANGLTLQEFKSQNMALLDFGIATLLENLYNKVAYKIYKQEADKIKILLSPTMMGDRFKMVRFRK